MKITKTRLKQIIQEEMTKVLSERDAPFKRSPEIVSEQIILKFIAGRNATMTPEGLLSALSGGSAKEYLERFGVTYQQVLPHLKNTIKKMMSEIKVSGNFKVYERDQNLQPEKGPNNIFVVTLSEKGEFLLDKETR